MSREWYYQSEHGVVGPHTFDQLRERARAGEIDRDTPVREGLTGRWMPARWVLGPTDRGRAAGNSTPPPDGPPSPPRAGAPRRRPTGSRALCFWIGVFLLVLVYGGVLEFQDRRREWRRQAASRPEALILGRWERVPAVGVKQSVVFHTDGVVEYDGPTEGLEFQRHVRYRFVDDRTVALLLTEASIRSLRDQFPEKRGELGTLRPGDEFARVTISFPSSRTMVATYVNGTRLTWTKAD